LSFTRASDATRVASNGLIEKVRTNVLLHSQTLDNAVWSLSNATISANATTAPDGTTTAEKLIPSAAADPAAADASQLQQIIAVASNTYTFSIFAKAAGQNSVRIRENNSWGNFLNLNLTTGVANIIGGNFGQFNNVQVQTLANGWFRLSFTTEAGVTNFSKYSIRGGETGDGTSGVFLWGAMLEVSDFGATDYIATTTAAVSVGPVSGLPRLDYLGSTCPRLLLEPQRTNLLTYSEQLNDASWTKQNTTATANQTISPDGYVNADKLEDSATGSSTKLISKTANTSGVHTISGYFKKAEYNFVVVHAFGFAGAVFNLNTGVKVSEGGGTGAIVDAGNGWYKCSFTFTGVGNTNIYFSQSIDGSITYSGTAGSGIFAWGLQVEAGAYATSYIPTLGASVTRVADAASKTGANVFFGTNTGTIVINFDSVGFDPSSGNYVFDLAAGVDAANRILVYFSPSDNTLRLFYARTDGTNAQQTFNVTMSAIKKVAVKWTASDIKMFYNGTPSASFAFGATAPNDLTLFARYTDVEHLAARASQVLTFPTALTDAQCIELTTL
jgi:hypothetical protein